MGLPLLMAVLAAGGVLLIVWALLGARTSDPVQARLSQLGTLEGVTSLEEIELQQPLMDRTMRPLMRRLSGIGTRLTSRERVGRYEAQLAEAGYPGGIDPATRKPLHLTFDTGDTSARGRLRYLFFADFGCNLFHRLLSISDRFCRRCLLDILCRGFHHRFHLNFGVFCLLGQCHRCLAVV